MTHHHGHHPEANYISSSAIYSFRRAVCCEKVILVDAVDFFMGQFNPDLLDRSAWLEQRRQMFLDASARNPYFKYSLLVTILLFLAMGGCAKLWYDLRKTKWIDAERLADFLSHDRYSREAAREAIRRYNEHIEKCNRVIEAQEASLSLFATAGGSDVAVLRAEFQETAAKLSDVTRERDQLKAELDATKLSVADLSLREESLARKGNGRPGGAKGLLA